MSIFSKLSKADADFDKEADALSEAISLDISDVTIVGANPNQTIDRLVALCEIASDRIDIIRTEIARLQIELTNTEIVHSGLSKAIETMHIDKDETRRQNDISAGFTPIVMTHENIAGNHETDKDYIERVGKSKS